VSGEPRLIVRDHRFGDDAFPQIVAHRGASSTNPENTLTSFEAAARLGARIVEFDVRLTADGAPVVIHDPTVDRTTDGSGAVHEMTAAEIASLGIGSAEHVPTLDEVLELLSGRTGVAIEIKVLPGEPGFDAASDAVVRATHDALERTAFVGPVLAMSFNPAWIDASRAIDPDVATGFLTTQLVPPGDALAFALANGHAMVLPGTRSLVAAGRTFVERAHAQGCRVGTWTADDPGAVRTLLEMGVDAIASNDPAMALGVLASR
jgi:glycerophosphoryl diester phosphodiesterase